MRWLVVVLAALVLLFWQYQSLNAPSTKSPRQNIQPEIAPHLVNITEKSSTHAAQLTVSMPQLNQQEQWLQPSLKDLFDYYLLEYEQQPEAMWAAFANYCQPLPHCEQITELFERYYAYKSALIEIDQPVDGSVVNVTERLSRLDDLRQAYFSVEEIQILFGEQLNWQEHALQRLAIRQDSSLSVAQKQALISEHYQTLDEQSYQAVAPSLALQKVTALAQQNGLVKQDYNQLAAEYGVEAAERLIAARQKQKAWQQKLSDYQQQLEQLKAEHGTNSETFTTATQALQQQMFTVNEMRRVKVLTQ